MATEKTVVVAADAADSDVVAESLRFVLRGVGAAPERVEALVARRADWRIAE